jgi:hypothetical protein
MDQHRRERGQALVLIILAIVGLFGFAALAVDGSRIYAERRRAQTAVDSAAYAAAFAGASDMDWMLVAHNQLKLNGYEDVNYAVVNPNQNVDVEMYKPPKDAGSGRYDKPNEYYHVIVTTTVDPVFAQIIMQGPFRITVEAVVRGKNPTSITPNRAMYSTSPNDCEAMKFHGNQNIKIVGGDIYSTSNRTGGMSGSPDPNSCCGISQDGGNTITVEQGGVYAVGSICGSNNGTINSDNGVNPTAPYQDYPTIPLPDCSGLETRTYSGGSANLLPGNYPGGIRITGSRTDVQLAPGMFCLYDDLTANGGRLVGNNVMIVMMKKADGSGTSIDLGGNTTVRLTQHPTLEDASGQTWGGMLFYMPYDNTGYIAMSGGAGTRYTGTVFAPGPRAQASQPKCTVTGSANSFALSSALICYSMKVGGTADITIYYREEQNYRIAPSLDLAR